MYPGWRAAAATGGKAMRVLRDGLLLLGFIGLTTFSSEAGEAGLFKQEARTVHYRLELQIGPTEKMLTPADAAASDQTTGEVMVGGDMSMTGMPMDMGDVRHLEVHVYPLDKGEAVTDANVTIAVTNTASRNAEDVPVAKMYGIKEGLADTNNVSLPAASYTIEVTVNGEKAEFALTIPAS
jgi:hypothetical protein